MNSARVTANRLMNTAVVALYRRSSGRVMGRGRGKLPILLLTVPGRCSRRPHTVPIVYLERGGDFLVVGTGLNGARETPRWFLNLTAAGTGHIQVRGRGRVVRARLADGAERDELWARIAERAPHFVAWQARTGRTFPVALLTPASTSS